jgi:hypothetical protein
MRKKDCLFDICPNCGHKHRNHGILGCMVKTEDGEEWATIGGWCRCTTRHEENKIYNAISKDVDMK